MVVVVGGGGGDEEARLVTRARAGGNEAAWCGATVRRASRQMTSSGQHYDHLLKLLLIGDSGRWFLRVVASSRRVASSRTRRQLALDFNFD